MFEAAGDDLALYIAYAALGQVANMRGQMDAALEAYERAVAHARQAGLPDELLAWRAACRFYGTTPVSELLAWLDEQEARGRWTTSSVPAGPWRWRCSVASTRRARSSPRRVRSWPSAAAESGSRRYRIESVDVELWPAILPPPPSSEQKGAGCSTSWGRRASCHTRPGRSAQALYELGRLEEAEAWAGRAAELGASDDAFTQMLWRQVKAKVLARRGEHAEAERLAREAVAIGEETDMLDAQGDAYADLAEVLALAGKPDEAAAALEQAVERYERKGNIVSTQRAQTRLAEIRAAAPR